MRHGPWKFDPHNRTLVHPSGYEVDFDRCGTAAAVLDWVAQISKKTWADDATIAGLVRILDDLLNLQGRLCPSAAWAPAANKPAAITLRANFPISSVVKQHGTTDALPRLPRLVAHRASELIQR